MPFLFLILNSTTSRERQGQEPNSSGSVRAALLALWDYLENKV